MGILVNSNKDDGSYVFNGKRYEWYQSPSLSAYFNSFINYLSNYVKEKEQKTLINKKQNFMNFDWLKKIDVGKWLRGAKIFESDKAEKLESNIELAAAKGVQYAEMVKEWINNPVEDFIMKFLPQKVQDAEAKLQTYLPVIIAGLLSIKDPLGMDSALKNVKLANDFNWDKFFHDMAVAIASVMADGKFTFSDLTFAVKLLKDHLPKTNTA